MNDDVVLNNASFSQLWQLIGESSPILINAYLGGASVFTAIGADSNMEDSQLLEELEDEEGPVEG